MDSIRVHLGQMPPMLRAMINDLLTGEPDIDVVGNSYAGEESLLAASADGADVLIAQEVATGSSCVGAVLTGSPAAILTIADDGHRGTGVNLVRDSVSLAGPEASGLADAVRNILSRIPSTGSGWVSDDH